MGLTEDKNAYRYVVQPNTRFDKIKINVLAAGVAVSNGRIRNTQRWEIQAYIFDKKAFKNAEQVRSWLETHLKSSIHTLLDFKTWDEQRRRMVNAFIAIGKVE